MPRAAHARSEGRIADEHAELDVVVLGARGSSGAHSPELARRYANRLYTAVAETDQPLFPPSP